MTCPPNFKAGMNHYYEINYQQKGRVVKQVSKNCLHRLWIPLTQNLCILLLTICNEQRIKLFIMAVNDFWQRNQINNHYSIWTLFIFQIWLIFVSQPSAQQQVLLSPLLGYHWLGDNNKLVDMPSLNSKCHHHKIFLANHFDHFLPQC